MLALYFLTALWMHQFSFNACKRTLNNISYIIIDMILYLYNIKQYKRHII